MIETMIIEIAIIFGVFSLIPLIMIIWGLPQVHKEMCRDSHHPEKTFHRSFQKFSEGIAKFSDKFGADLRYPNKIFLLFPKSGSMFSKTDYDDNFYIHADIVCINGEKYIAKYFWNYWKMVFVLRKMYSEKVANKEYSFRYFGRS
jgi:hypothetical protein